MDFMDFEKYSAEVKEIEERLTNLKKMLRDFSRGQIELWCQVPALAEKLDKLQVHHSGRLQLAYLTHRWPIFITDLLGLYVDLKTGELFPEYELDNLKLSQLTAVLEKVNAQFVINNLKSEINKLSIVVV